MPNFVKLDSGSFVVEVVEVAVGDEAFALSLGYIPGDGAAMGDFWNGTTFVTPPPPPPPPPTMNDYSTALDVILTRRAEERRDAMRDAILLADPSIETLIEFKAAAETYLDNQ